MKKLKALLLILASFILMITFASCQNTTQNESTTVDNTTANEQTTNAEGSESESSSETESASETVSGSASESEFISETESESESETESESESESETETQGPEMIEKNVEEFVCFVNTESSNHTGFTLASNTYYGMNFTIPDGYLTSLNVFCAESKPITISIYKWDTDHATTVASTPVYENTLTAPLANTCVEAVFEPDQITAGKYTIKLTAENGIILYASQIWTKNTMPEDMQQYNISYFQNGGKAYRGSTFPLANLTFNHTISVEKVEPTPVTKEKDAKDDVKVILLAGQSNACGVSRADLLKNNIGLEKYNEYTKGYDNISIYYYTGDGNKSDGFVKTTFGQGAAPGFFGPEIGLAAYFAEHYPDEEFRIVKCAIGGSVLATEWFAPETEGGAEGKYLTKFKSMINDALQTIKNEGKTPKIVSFCWMQGESDGIWQDWAYDFDYNQHALVTEIRTVFAADASVRGIAFMDAGIADCGYWSLYRKINLVKLNMSEESELNYYIDTIGEGLTTLNENNDIAHYDSTSMFKLGWMYGECIAQAMD